MAAKHTSPTLRSEPRNEFTRSAVGCYGRQLGQLGDALEAVFAHMKTDTWNEEAKEAVTAFRLRDEFVEPVHRVVERVIAVVELPVGCEDVRKQ